MWTSIKLKLLEYKAKNDLPLVFMRVIVFLSIILCMTSLSFGNYTSNNPKYDSFNRAIEYDADFKCSLVASVAVTIPLFLDITLDAIYFPTVDRHLFERFMFAISIVIIAVVPLSKISSHDDHNAQAYIATNNIQNVILFYCSIAICYKIYPHVWTALRVNFVLALWCFIQIWGCFFFNSTGEAALVSLYTYSTILYFCNFIFLVLTAVTSYEIYKHIIRRKEEAGFMYLSGNDTLVLLFLYGPLFYSILLYIWIVIIRDVPVLTTRKALDLTITTYLTCFLTVIMVVIPARIVRFEVIDVQHALETKKSIARHVYNEMRTPLNLVVLGLELLSSTIKSISTVASIEFEQSKSYQPLSNGGNGFSNRRHSEVFTTDEFSSNSNNSGSMSLQNMRPGNQKTMDHLKVFQFNQVIGKAEEAYEIMEDVMISCGHTVEILNDMLQFENLENNGICLELQPFSILPFIGQIAKPFMAMANRKGLRMKIVDKMILGSGQVVDNFASGVEDNENNWRGSGSGGGGPSVMPVNDSTDHHTKGLLDVPSQAKSNGVPDAEQQSHILGNLLEDGKSATSDMKCVCIDAVKIAQILRNFLANALKYTDIGSVNIVVKLVQPRGNTTKLFRNNAMGRFQRSWYALTGALISTGSFVPRLIKGNKVPSAVLPTTIELGSGVSPDGDTHYQCSDTNNENCQVRYVNGDSEMGLTDSRRVKGLKFHRNLHGTMVRISVTDTGSGVSHENIKQLFGDVVELNAAEIQGGGESGFGLKIAKGILNLHGGSVGVSSNGIDKGSTFFIEIPLYELQESSECYPVVDSHGLISVVENKPKHSSHSEDHVEPDKESDNKKYACDNGFGLVSGVCVSSCDRASMESEVEKEGLNISKDESLGNTGSGALLNVPVLKKRAPGEGPSIWDRLCTAVECVLDFCIVPPYHIEMLDSNGDVLLSDYDCQDMIPPSSFLQSQEDSISNRVGWNVNSSASAAADTSGNSSRLGLRNGSVISLNYICANNIKSYGAPSNRANNMNDHFIYNMSSPVNNASNVAVPSAVSGDNGIVHKLRRILIVDPSMVCRRVLGKVLISMDRNLIIDEADDGRACVELVYQHRRQMLSEVLDMEGVEGEEVHVDDYYDVIILDSLVCTLSGSDTSLELRKGAEVRIIRDNSASSCLMQPFTGCAYKGLVVGLSGSADKRDFDALFKAGADSVITKPLDTRLLLDILKKYERGVLVSDFHDGHAASRTTSGRTIPL